ncbi:sterol desaturase family protein [Archangium sp.]|jgi:sterol desaturase/sphingolipid hydroxylase (fatty acid hydroxylase superfamily)|uniref:sterol desaturase family protein n=1 Tax=Archangium sp. TaxID=1872627 RepID=UPI002EDB3704
MHFELEAFLDRSQFPLMIAVLVLLLVLETYRPFVRGRRGRLVHGLRHGGLFLLSIGVSGFIIVLTNTLAVRAAEHHFGLLNLVALPSLVHVVLGLLMLDLVSYGLHLLSHKVPLLWRLHRVHHSDAELDVTTVFRLHPLEGFAVLVCQLLTVVAFGVPMLALLLYAVLSTTSALLQHANLRLPTRVDRWMSWVFTSPGMHHVHHSRHVEETDTNYGRLFAWWDRLFGTYRMPPEDLDIELGLAEFAAPRYQSFRGLLMTPFMTPEAPRPAPPAPKPAVVPVQ